MAAKDAAANPYQERWGHAQHGSRECHAPTRAASQASAPGALSSTVM
jgi:hypothetical protein